MAIEIEFWGPYQIEVEGFVTSIDSPSEFTIGSQRVQTDSPGVVLISETNVPHEENIRYFGDGYDEAQLVYNWMQPMPVPHCRHQFEILCCHPKRNTHKGDP